MEEKENVKEKTKIPLPIDPLPQVPELLVNSTTRIRRQPLKVINSTGTNNVRLERTYIFCSNNVTVRESTLPSHKYHYNKNELVSKELKVKKDNKGKRNTKLARREEKEKKDKEEVSGIRNDNKNGGSRTKNDDCREDSNGVVECVLLNLDETTKQKTPTTYLEHPRIRNIKKSLKRPHSRELQGISPIKLCENNSRFYNGDSIDNRLQKWDDATISYTETYFKNYTKNLFKYLIEVEKKPLGIPKLCGITRTCIVNWILKLNGEDGNPAKVQTACWYFDSLSSLIAIKLENLQLVAAACYWIAQKLHGPNITATKLVKSGGESYTTAQLCRAEQKVLHLLKFPSQPVVPQDYISYLSYWCDSQNNGIIEVASSFICLCGILIQKSVSCEYASVLASAAVYSAIQLLNKSDVTPRLLSNEIFTKARKKTTDFGGICRSLQECVGIVGHPCSEYRAPFDHYSRPPHFIAKKILAAIKDTNSVCNSSKI